MEERAQEYLLRIPFWTKKKNTLEQVGGFLEELGNPEEGLRIIHVAGTNGKGSVCADLTGILKEAGYRVGTFVSPHLVDVRERFLLDGKMISPEDLQSVFETVLAAARRMQEKGYFHPTFFEFVFLMAMVWFKQKQADVVVLETGLGGRLDTTNVIRRPAACVITSISLDHTQYLGGTIPEIAAEKAGIIKEGVPIIYDDNQPPASAVLLEKARRMHAPAYPVTEAMAGVLPGGAVARGDETAPCGTTGEAPGQSAGAASDRDLAAVLDQVSFAAPYQRMDAALALRTLQVLALPGITVKTCREGLKKVRWQGRMEEAIPGVWLDGAHNPGGIQALIRAVRQKEGNAPVHLLFAAVSDKEYGEMIRLLCEGLRLEQVTVAHMESERGTDQQLLAGQFAQAGCGCVEQFATVREALLRAMEKKPEGRHLYVCGSLYLIGEIKALLRAWKEPET